MGPLFWVVVAATALSCFFAVTGASLRVVRRVAMEEHFVGPAGREHLLRLERHLPALRWTTSFLRAAANLAVTVAVLYLFDVWRGGPGRLAGAVAVVAALITLFSIVIPQAWASYAGERVLRRTLGLLIFLRYLLYPVVAVMSAFDLPIRRLSGVIEASDENGESAKAEILQAASDGAAEGAVDAEEVEMIESVMEFGDTRANEIMTPRTDLFALPVDLPWEEACEAIVQAGHTRVPVYDGDLDNIIGVLYAKDLLPRAARSENATLRETMRKPYFVPETMPLDDLLREFKRRKVHLAVVLDEYGGTAGIATIEDLLEEIVGDIADEYDRDEVEDLRRIDARTVEIDARMHIDDLNDAIGLELPEDEDYETVAGFVFSELGYIPPEGEQLESRDARFSILAADERKITRLRVERLTTSEEPEDETG